MDTADVLPTDSVSNLPRANRLLFATRRVRTVRPEAACSMDSAQHSGHRDRTDDLRDGRGEPTTPSRDPESLKQLVSGLSWYSCSEPRQL
jgi:hypothetical protein